MDLAVRTERLGKQYPGGQGIREVSLRVPRGSIYGFLGPNGAGKTTTIRLLLGLLRPQHGSIELLGMPLDAQPRVLSKVGALVESPSLYPHLSGRNNLEVTRRLLGLPPSSIDKVLGWTELADAAHRRVSEYSLGMRQRLGIALALLGSPELLILDEPSNGLDPAGMADLRRMLNGFAQQFGITVLVSSHLLGEVEQVATHIGVMHSGELRFQGTVDQLRERRAPRVRMRFGDSLPALAWLHANGHAEAVMAEGWITADADNRTVPRLMHRLFGAGFDVLELGMQQSSLEDSFFDLTESSSAERDAA